MESFTRAKFLRFCDLYNSEAAAPIEKKNCLLETQLLKYLQSGSGSVHKSASVPEK